MSDTNLDIVVRKATQADLNTLVTFNAAMAMETEGKTLDLDMLKKGVSAVLGQDGLGFYLIAEVDGRPVGQLMITTEWSDWRNGYFWWIQSVYVDAEYRRQGVYRALDSHVHAEARRKENVCGLRLYVERNNHVAQQVYSSLDMHRSHYDLFEIDFVL